MCPALSSYSVLLPSVLWRCWLGGRKGIQSVKNWVVGCWRGCLEQGADLHMAQLMPLPLTVFCFSKIQIGFTFPVLAHLGNPGKKGTLNRCVCVQVWTANGTGHQRRQRRQSVAAEDGVERWWGARQGKSGYCRPNWGLFYLFLQCSSHCRFQPYDCVIICFVE